MNAVCDFIERDRNGFICELSETDAAENILRGLSEGADMAESCIENASRYDWERIFNLTESIYEEAIT